MGVATAVSAVSMIRGPWATGAPTCVNKYSLQSGRRAPDKQILIQGPFRTSYTTVLIPSFSFLPGMNRDWNLVYTSLELCGIILEFIG